MGPYTAGPLKDLKDQDVEVLEFPMYPETLNNRNRFVVFEIGVLAVVLVVLGIVVVIGEVVASHYV